MYALILLSRIAHAADGFDAHGFTLSAMDKDLRDPITVERAGLLMQGDYFVGALAEYADDLLVFIKPDADGNLVETPILDNLLAIDMVGGYSPMDRLRLGVGLPLYLNSQGPEILPNGAGLGDIRLTAMYNLIQSENDQGLALAVIPALVLPTGNTSDFLGESGVSGAFKIASSYNWSQFSLSGSVGVKLVPEVTMENLRNPDQLSYGIAGSYLLNPKVGLITEIHGALPFSKNDVSGTEAPTELNLSLRSAVAKSTWVVGTSTALSSGVGAAKYRLYLGGGFGHYASDKPPIVDTDGDGLLDPDDGCPLQPETFNQYRDSDGCPDTLGSLSVSVRRDGQEIKGAKVKIYRQPVNGEVLSEADAAPYAVINDTGTFVWDARPPGSAYQGQARDGSCWSGESTVTVGEGTSEMVINLHRSEAPVRVVVKGPKGKPLPNAMVTWGKDPSACANGNLWELGPTGTGTQNVGIGTHTIFVTAPDFSTYTAEIVFVEGQEKLVEVTLQPSRLRVEQAQIVILEKVYFDINSALIQARSYELLNEIATVLKSHPEIALVEIQGHTDSDGKDEANMILSQGRVDSVMRYLMAQGVDPTRLVAKGYGETQPIASNTTAEGKAENRRVEFKILKREEEEE